MSGIQAASAGLAYWIRLEQTRGVGPETARKLLAVFGLPENIFHAGQAALQKVVSERVAAELAAPVSDQLQALIDKTLAWAQQPGNHVLTLADAQYPQTLLDIADPPLMLYAKGRIELLSRPSIAIVGSRNATTQGMLNAERFAEAFGRAGLAVVSGMALGIDTAAHQGGLQSANEPAAGSTIAVIGTGADIVYPARNRALAHRIAEAGCIVSEYPLGMPAIAANFPRRNRIISGLSCAVLVVEAAAQSGSLITARMALDQGREVFAIPGSIHSPLSKGCHQLIKQGAKLVESAQDVIEEIAPQISAAASRPASESTDFGAISYNATGYASGPDHEAASNPHAGAGLLHAMGFDPVHANVLSERTGLEAALLNAQLLELELEGLIELLPGGLYRRIA